MTLSNNALVTLAQAKAYLKIDPDAALHILAEYVGTGNGTNVTFTLDHAPLEGTLKVYVDSVLKTLTTDYSYSSTTLTFTSAGKPGNGAVVTAAYDYAAADNTFEAYDDDILEQLIEAATKKCEDFCERKFVNTTLTEKHVGDGSKILRLYYRPVNSVTSVSYELTEAFKGDGSTKAFTLAETPVSGTFLVYVDGVLKTVTTHYTQTGKALTFTDAPSDRAKIIVKYSVALDLIDDYEEQLSIGRLRGSWLKDYTYQVVYSAGYGADRATVQPLIPDAVTAVLIAIANWHENRLGVSTQSISGVGSASYDQGLPEASKKLLGGIKV